MRWLKSVILGTILGGIGGGFVGYIMVPDIVAKAYHGVPTIWHDLGPLLFIPVWIGAMIGFGSKVFNIPFMGTLLTVAAGMLAGFLAPTLHEQFFGQGPFPTGFLGYPRIYQFLLIFLGGVGGAFWHATIGKFI
ncbi:MAG: hypothetical protein HY399_08450 [Elusimicrobia bacterium]|nr:hypothetical protein [Elusimicrobiota bacterium]